MVSPRLPLSLCCLALLVVGWSCGEGRSGGREDSGAAPAPSASAEAAPASTESPELSSDGAAEVEEPDAEADEPDADLQDSDAGLEAADGSPGSGEGGPGLFPDSRPYRRGRFKVSDRHELYFELVGDKRATPLIVLHGGPGGQAGAFTRQFFDPERFHVLLFDQRGAGRSRPRAEWRENTTQLLIDDIDRLREHLGLTEPAILFGGSWGSTLAVAYAEAHPEKVAGLVLGGIFLCSKAEIDHFYHGGTAPFYPKNFASLQSVLPHPERLDYPAQLFALITGADSGRAKQAIDAWARYEIRMTRMEMTDEEARSIVARSNLTAFSTLENHYMSQGCFLEERQLLRDAGRIAQIPTSIVNGRHDLICPPRTAIELASRLKRVKLEVVPLGAHSGRDDPIAKARLRGIDWVARQVEASRGER